VVVSAAELVAGCRHVDRLRLTIVEFRQALSDDNLVEGSRQTG